MPTLIMLGGLNPPPHIGTFSYSLSLTNLLNLLEYENVRIRGLLLVGDSPHALISIQNPHRKVESLYT